MESSLVDITQYIKLSKTFMNHHRIESDNLKSKLRLKPCYTQLRGQGKLIFLLSPLKFNPMAFRCLQLSNISPVSDEKVGKHVVPSDDLLISPGMIYFAFIGEILEKSGE